MTSSTPFLVLMMICSKSLCLVCVHAPATSGVEEKADGKGDTCHC